MVCGDGASAVLLVCALARQAGQALSVIVIGEKGEPGRGIAYSTANPAHLLNVPAVRMSANINRPDQFVRWLAEHGIVAASWEQSFVSRAHYGAYLSDLLDATLKSNPDLAVRFVRGRIKSLMRKNLGWVVAHDGGTIDADLVVLATGNDRPPPIAPHYPRALASRITDDPWSEPDLAPDCDVLLLGAGLTAIDAAIGLHSRGHAGNIYFLSRHGLLPRSHVEPAAAPPLDRPFPASPRGLLRAMRAKLGPSVPAAHWQGFMDAMRPHWPQIWQSFSVAEKKRFLRHAATLWNVHRHRLAPAVGAFLAQGLSRNLHLLKGRLRHLEAGGSGLIATIDHGGRATRLGIGHVINCTGPNANPDRTHDGLIENLVASRLARAGEAGIGLDVDRRNRVLDKSGTAQPSLLAMAALTRGHWWEITAIPEIAQQAQIMSGAIMEYLGILTAAARINRRH